MPELPEVETIRIGLEKYLKGAKVELVEVRLPKMFSGDPKLVEGQSIVGVRRFGKGLVIDFTKDYSLAVHVKMTGQLIYIEKGKEGVFDKDKVGQSLPNKHTHVIINLKSQIPALSAGRSNFKSKNPKAKQDGTLFYNDIRQFGWMRLFKTQDLKEQSFFKDLGPEPPVVPHSGTMEGQAQFDLSSFREILKHAKMPIKTLLMDQKRIAGVGNIYANDALYLAKIHPKRKANSLSTKETEELFNALEAVLRKGLEVGGASEWQFVNADGQTGGYQNFFQVYGKVGKSCPKCGNEIEKISLGGRGTFYCSNCQK